MTLSQATEIIRDKVGADAGLKAAVKFAFRDEGTILVDARTVPNQVSNDDGPADCTIRISLADFERLLTGDLDKMWAYMTGKLKVEGSIAVAMSLGRFIGSGPVAR